jgi:hypothetical protein
LPRCTTNRPPDGDPGEPAGRCGDCRAPQPPAFRRADRRGSCPLVAGRVELRRASALEVRRSRLARDLPVAHPSRVARRAEDRPLAPRATNTCVHGGVGAMDGLPGAACAPAPLSTVAGSGLTPLLGTPSRNLVPNRKERRGSPSTTASPQPLPVSQGRAHFCRS